MFLSYEFTCTPVECTNMKPVSHIEIVSTDFVTEAEKAALKSLEDAIWGTDGENGAEGTAAYLPLPNAVKTLLTVNNGNG